PHVHGRDGLGDAGIPFSQVQPRPTPAAQLIIETARTCPGEITLIAVGPLTNLALALLLWPGLAQAVHRVIIMGGAA
ncbi:MAG: nucleoside hydrolase, partial [Chloroflexota bacterium]